MLNIFYARLGIWRKGFEIHNNRFIEPGFHILGSQFEICLSHYDGF